jgi:excisionase family DNA binding protein
MLPVTREVVLALAGGLSAFVERPTGADLTVAELAVRFGRSRSTIRMWLEAGKVGGAYRFQNREWRVPARMLAAFEESERERAAKPRGIEPVRATAGGVVDLSEWRRAGA